jgi:spore cortex formation protein SpoVR/YcgB (stage V sporulation)
MNRLHEKGLLTDGSMLEFLHSHTSVVFQPEYDDPRYSGINPYALGFAMMDDIKRICLKPTEEDRRFFPQFAGNKDPYGTLRDAWANYRDESFILQFLSPQVIRKFRLFSVYDNAAEPTMLVDAIHDETGYREIRSALARSYDLSRREPDIQVVDVDMTGDRTLKLRNSVHDGIVLDEKTARSVLRHVADLWTYGVKLEEVDASTDAILKTHEFDGANSKRP